MHSPLSGPLLWGHSPPAVSDTRAKALLLNLLSLLDSRTRCLNPPTLLASPSHSPMLHESSLPSVLPSKRCNALGLSPPASFLINIHTSIHWVLWLQVPPRWWFSPWTTWHLYLQLLLPWLNLTLSRSSPSQGMISNCSGQQLWIHSCLLFSLYPNIQTIR